MFLGLLWISTTLTAVGWTIFVHMTIWVLNSIHKDLRFELVKPGVCVRVFKYTLPPRCTTVSRFCFVVHVLCTRPCYVHSWLHCWANWGALRACRSVCVLTPTHYGFNPHSLASSRPVWGGDLEWCLLPARAMDHFQRGVSVCPPPPLRLIPTARQPRLGLSRLPLACQARSTGFVFSNTRFLCFKDYWYWLLDESLI